MQDKSRLYLRDLLTENAPSDEARVRQLAHDPRLDAETRTAWATRITLTQLERHGSVGLRPLATTVCCDAVDRLVRMNGWGKTLRDRMAAAPRNAQSHTDEQFLMAVLALCEPLDSRGRPEVSIVDVCERLVVALALTLRRTDADVRRRVYGSAVVLLAELLAESEYSRA